MDATRWQGEKGHMDTCSVPTRLDYSHCTYIRESGQSLQKLHTNRSKPGFFWPGKAIQCELSQTLSQGSTCTTQESSDPDRCGPEFCSPGTADQGKLNQVPSQACDIHNHSDPKRCEQETCSPEQCELTLPGYTDDDSDTDTDSLTDDSLNQAPPQFNEIEARSNPKRCEVGVCSYGGLSLARTLPGSLKYHAFFCYSWKDKDWVLRLIHTLETPPYNYLCCYDDRNFEYNQSILDNIPECMDTSLKVVLVLSPNFIESNWCDFEARQTMEKDIESRGRKLIPIMYKDCDVPKYLSQVMYIDAKSDRFMERLVKTLNSTQPRNDLHRLSHTPEYHQTHNGDVMFTEVIDKEKQPPFKLPKELVNHHCPGLTYTAYKDLVTKCIEVNEVEKDGIYILTLFLCVLVGYFGSLDVVLGSMGILHAIFHSFARASYVRFLMVLAFIYKFQDFTMFYCVALYVAVYIVVTKVLRTFNTKTIKDHHIVIIGLLCLIVLLLSLTGIKTVIGTLCLLHFAFQHVNQNFVFRCIIIIGSVYLFGPYSVVTAIFLIAFCIAFKTITEFSHTHDTITTLHRSNILVLFRNSRLWTTSAEVHFVYYNLRQCLAYLDDLQTNTFNYQADDMVSVEHHILMPEDILQRPVTRWQLYCYLILVTKNRLPPGGEDSHAMQVICLCHFLQQSYIYRFLRLFFYMIKDALFLDVNNTN